MKILRWMAGLALAMGMVGAAVAVESAPAASPAGGDGFGVLVMAHGGGAQWNSEVTKALAPLAADMPLEIAFGMADAGSLEKGVQALQARGVKRIGVVRLFVSGESWLERTGQILGVAPGAPAKGPHDGLAGHGAHGGHAMGFWRVDGDAVFALSREGLADAPEMGAVLVDRARALSADPVKEDVLVLAHGPGDDAENARWLVSIDARAQAVRAALPFRRVQVETLREDWPDKRVAAEQRIRAFVERAKAEGGRAIVLPYRVQGFGPYAKVLEGLEYTADRAGLVPHVAVERWVRRQTEALRQGDFQAQVPKG